MDSQDEEIKLMDTIDSNVKATNNVVVLPCPVTTSSALFFIVVTSMVVAWILYRFFSTFGLEDIRVKLDRIRKQPPEFIDSPRLPAPPLEEQERKQSFLSNSSEEFPLRPPTPLVAKSPLLRIIITLTQLMSILLLLIHFSLSFTTSYRICRTHFGSLVPFLDDQTVLPSPTPSLDTNSIRGIASNSNSTVAVSVFLLDLSRTFMLIGLILLLTHFTGAVHRRIPPSLSRGGYFSIWKNKLIIGGYCYTVLSLIIVLLLQSIPTTLSAQHFLNFETFALFIISGLVSGLFCRKRFQQLTSVSQTFGTGNVISSFNIFSKQKVHVQLCEKHTTEFFSEMSFVLSLSLLVHVMGSSFSYFYYKSTELLPSPWVMSLLYWMQYIPMPFIAILIIIIIYPREDANVTWKLNMDAWNPLFTKNNSTFIETDLVVPSTALTSLKCLSRNDRLGFYHRPNVNIHKLSEDNMANMASFSSFERQLSPSFLRATSSFSIGGKTRPSFSMKSNTDSVRFQSPSVSSDLNLRGIQYSYRNFSYDESKRKMVPRSTRGESAAASQDSCYRKPRSHHLPTELGSNTATNQLKLDFLRRS